MAVDIYIMFPYDTFNYVIFEILICIIIQNRIVLYFIYE